MTVTDGTHAALACNSNQPVFQEESMINGRVKLELCFEHAAGSSMNAMVEENTLFKRNSFVFTTRYRCTCY